MPINSYTLLKSFTDGSKVLSSSEVAKALKPYNIYAFIIHDPEEHRELDLHIAEYFEFLDSTTGKNLLFFALTEPPREWMEYANKRPYYQAFDNYFINELLCGDKLVKSKNPGLTAFTLANQLKISYDDLPCIVVTTNFRKQDFIWFKTCPRHINTQLGFLGHIAGNLIEHRNPDFKGMTFTQKSESFYKILQEKKDKIDLCDGQGEITLNSSLAKALTDVLSFDVASSEGDWLVIKEAKEQALHSLDTLKKQMAKLKTEKECNDEELDELCIMINSFEALMLREQATSNINRNYFEKDSYKMLETAIMILNYLNTQPNHDYDYTPSIVCLAKVFEKEINLSMVHWIRNKLGIDLPKYFNKYQKGKNAEMIPNIDEAFNIDFNRNSRGKWLPPGIGQSRLCWETIISKEVPEEWNNEIIANLKEKWKLIAKLRNQAAHTAIMNRSHANQMYDHIVTLINNGGFDIISQTKEKFRPDN
jgi:hypothetical protein